MPEQARILTPITMATAAPILEGALDAAGVANLAQDMCALLLAQIALEVANGNQCFNHNPGNITAQDKGPRDFYRPIWFTVDANTAPNLIARHNEMTKGQAPNAFRSYPDFLAGFQDHANTLVHTFPSIINAARSGDALQVAGAIRSSGYTPGINVTAVAASLDSLRKQFLGRGFFSELPLDEAATTPQS